MKRRFGIPDGALRRATPADANPVAALVRECYGGYVERIGREPKPMMADYAESIRNHEIWLLADGETLSAVLELIPATDHLLIENVAVTPRRQGRGIGRRLMSFAEDRAREEGHGEVRLYTNAAFVENIVLYESIGYLETRREEIAGSWVVFMNKPV